jgi:alginate O-acetyltransferase complex protein AlgI
VAFQSFQFVYFFLATVTASWLLRRWRLYQKLFLLLASYYFYARWDLKLFAFLAGLSAMDWLVGRAIARGKTAGSRKGFVALGVGINVAFLAFFKLYDFFRASLASFADFLGLHAHLPVLEIIAPVGISFYAFQGIAYLVDVYRGNAVEDAPLLDFLLFMAFFPKVLAGPICRSNELLPQIMAESPDGVPEPSRAVTLILSGLFKKMVLASLLQTRMVDEAFRVPTDHSSIELWLAVYAYTAQIYLDFSGYTDLARGLSLLLGFHLPENFKYPYAATNIGEFWRRWHITFSTWLRDYIYFPLGGSRRSRPRNYLNLVITFGVCGLWHGAKWTFVSWGVVHGIGLAVYRLSLDLRRDRGIDPYEMKPWYRLLAGWAVTLSFCAFARILFKATDFANAGDFVAGLCKFTVRGQGIDVMVVLVTIIGIAMNFVGRPLFEACVRMQTRIPAGLRPLVWATCGVVLVMAKTHEVPPYIYFGF